MADNTEEVKPAEETAPAAGSADEQGMSGDQSFAYWITILPFLAMGGVFIFEFSKTPGDYNKLINAAGVVVVGLFVAAFVNALTQGGDKKDDAAASSGDAPKPEGSS